MGLGDVVLEFRKIKKFIKRPIGNVQTVTKFSKDCLNFSEICSQRENHQSLYWVRQSGAEFQETRGFAIFSRKFQIPHLNFSSKCLGRSHVHLKNYGLWYIGLGGWGLPTEPWIKFYFLRSLPIFMNFESIFNWDRHLMQDHMDTKMTAKIL